MLSADAMQGRGTGLPGGIKAREYVIGKFKAAHLNLWKESYIQSFEVKSRGATKLSGANIIGMIKGTVRPEKYIVVSAHYDHLGIRNGNIYNGADDNASGVSALFAMANYFNQHHPRNSLIFVAFDAEEIGLQGSQYFAEHLPVEKTSILLDINLDMIAHNDKNELYAAGSFSYPFLKPYLEAIQKTAKVKLLIGHDDPKQGKDDWSYQSDQWSFHQQKIPFIYFGVEDHKDYHQPTDDFSTINQTFYIHAVETILSAVELIDKDLK